MDLNKLLQLNQIRHYLETLRVQGKSEATIRRKAIALKKFAEWAATKEQSRIGIGIGIIGGTKPKTFKEQVSHKILNTKYQILNTLSSVPAYFKFGAIAIMTVALGLFIYDQFIKKAPEQLAYPSTLTAPSRVLSFQGRLTDDQDTPITDSTNFVFKLWKVEENGTEVDCDGGGDEDCLWESNTCGINPDEDGIFSVRLGATSGSDACGGAIDSSVFTENIGIWLEVTVASETLDPRQPIATSAYALNAETLQGFPPGTGTSNILYIDSSGNIGIGVTSPTLDATSSSGTFAIKGQSLLLQTPNTSDGDIGINPDGEGVLDLIFDGSAPSSSYTSNGIGGFVTATNSNITSGAMYFGEVASVATGYDFIQFMSGSTPTEKFSVDASGHTYIAGNVGIGTTNPNNFKLQVDGNVGPQTDSDYDLGSDTIRWANVYADNLIGTISPGFSEGSVIFADSLGDLTEDNANFFWNDTDDRLGIGTTEPGAKLHTYRNDTIGTWGAMTLSNATALFQDSGVNLYVDGNTLVTSGDLYLGTSTASDIFFGTNDAYTVTFKSGGDVGIGTTEPSALLSVGSTSQFQVNSSGAIAAATGITSSGTITFSDLSTNGPTYVATGVMNSEQYLDMTRGGTDADLSGVAEGGLIYKAASALAGTGALTGMLKGNTASAPSAVTSTADYVTYWSDANTITGEQYLSVSRGGSGIGTFTKGVLLSPGGTTAFTTVAGINNYIPKWSSSYITTTSSIYDDGDVGIGTTGPGQKLTVQDDNSDSIPTDQDLEVGQIQIQNLDASAVFAGLSFRARTTNRAMGLIGLDWASGAGDIFFRIRDGSLTSKEVMRLESTGNVGIGTTDPQALLSVGSTSQFQVNSTGAIAAATGITSSGTITFSGLTANRLVTTTTGGQLTNSITSANVDDSVTNNTGSGLLVFATSPIFTTDITTPQILSSADLTIDPAGENVNLGSGDNLNITASTDLFFGTTSLGEITGPTDSGAYVVGTNDEFSNSDEVNVQGVLDDLDAHIESLETGGSGLWIDDGLYIYPINFTDFVITDAGNVGIGTTGPDSPLEISGSGAQQLKITSTDHISSAVVLERTDNDYYDWRMMNSGGNLFFSESIDEGASWLDNVFFGGDPTYHGRVGIGTTAPDEELTVSIAQNESTLIKVTNSTNDTLAAAGFYFDSATSNGIFAALPSNYTGGGTGAHFADRVGFTAYDTAAGLDVVAIDTNADIRFYTGGLAISNERIRIESGGNVGIGTTGPNAQFEVRGSGLEARLTDDGTGYYADLGVDSSGNLTISTSNGALNLEPTANQNLNITTSGTGDVAVNTNQLYVDSSSGYIGIGTTGPLVKLNVSQDQVTSISQAQFMITGATDTNKRTLIGYNTTNNYGWMGAGTLDSQWDPLVLQPISGNVGIGTTNPGAKLEVAGQVKITGGSPGADKVLTSNVSGLATWETIGGEGVTPDSLDYTEFVDAMTVDDNTSINLYSGTTDVDLRYYNSSSSDELLFLDGSTGYVGIGTTGPGARLDIHNDASTGVPLNVMSRAGSADNGELQIGFINNDGGQSWRMGTASDRNFYITEDDAGGYGTSRLTLEEGGNVGIGTTNPSATLHVAGNTLTTGNTYIGATTGDQYFWSDSAGRIATMADFYVQATSSNTYLYSAITYLGAASGDNILFRANEVYGDSWRISSTTGAYHAGSSTEYVYNRFGSGGTANFASDDASDVYVQDELEVDGSICLGGVCESTFLDFGPWDYNSGANTVHPDSTSYNVGIGTTSAGTAKLAVIGGNVGIGTTGPGYKLDVNAGTDNEITRFISTDDSARILVTDEDTTTYLGSSNGYTYLGGGAGLLAQNLVINTTTGNVGIGTTDPKAELHVMGTSGTIPSLFSGTNLVVSNTEAAGNNTNISILGGAEGDTAIMFGDTADEDAGAVSYDHNTDYMSFRVNAGTKMTIDDSGNVGIGTTGPGMPLHLTKASNDLVEFESTNSWMGLHLTGAAGYDSNIYFKEADTKEMRISWDASENELAFVDETDSAARRMVIEQTGNVGIGTTGPTSLLHLASTSTSTGFTGFNLDWSPGSAATLTGDLFAINIGSNGNADNLFNVLDNSSSLFSVSETQITSALPHQFTSTGDVSIAYDIIFTNQTASYIKSYAPLYIDAGESFESNDLTLSTYNAGDIVFDAGDASGDTGTIKFYDAYVKGATDTTPIAFSDVAADINTFRTNYTDENIIGAFNEVYDAATGSVGGGGPWTRSGTDTYLTNTGDNVGIGTTDPDNKLDISGTLEVGTSTRGALLYSTAADNFRFHTYTNTPNPNIRIGYGNGSGGQDTSSEYIDMNAGEINFINADVGIGIATPDEPLEIYRSNDPTAGTTYLKITNPSSGNWKTGEAATGIRFEKEGKITGYIESAHFRTGSGADHSNEDAGLAFGTRHSHDLDPTTKMVIDNYGNVGIGTTTPGAKLDILSTGEQLRTSYNSSNYTQFETDSDGDLNITLNGGGSDKRVIISNDLQINGGDIVDSSGTTRISIGNVISLYPDSSNLVRVINTSGSPASRYLPLRLTRSYSSFSTSYEVGIQFDIQENTTVMPAGFISSKITDSTNEYGKMFLATSDGTGDTDWEIGITIDHLGNVGIGTTNPTEKLHVVGDGYFTADVGIGTAVNATYDLSVGSHIRTVSGNIYSGGTQGFVFGSSTSEGEYIYRSGNDIRTYAGGANVLTVDGDNGRVGIGTTGPEMTLDVYGGVGTGIIVGDHAVRQPYIRRSLHSPSDVTYSFYGYTDAGMYMPEANKLAFAVNGGERITLDSGGNVGIGTTSPLGQLDVVGGVTRTGTAPTTPSFYVTGTLSAGTAGPAANNIEFRHDNQTQGIGFGYQTIYATGTTTNQPLNLLSRGSSPITLNAYGYSTGNVGIGTAGPLSKLSVGGAGISNTGVYGYGTSYGVYGGGGTYGVYGSGTGYGVRAMGGTYGLYGSGTSYGAYGAGDTSGVYGDGGTYGVYGDGTTGVRGDGTYGVYGYGTSQGVYGTTSTGQGVRGNSTSGWAGYFDQKTYVADYLRADGGLTTNSTDPGAGNIRASGSLTLTAANPYIYSGSSYIIIPNGLFVSGGTPYFTNDIKARGGISDDGGNLYLNDTVVVNGNDGGTNLYINAIDANEGGQIALQPGSSYSSDVFYLDNVQGFPRIYQSSSNTRTMQIANYGTGILNLNVEGTSTDFAEMIHTDERLESGDLVVSHESQEVTVRLADDAYSPNITGIISTRPGILLSSLDKANDTSTSIGTVGKAVIFDKYAPLTVSGRVPLKVSSSSGYISNSDPVTSSSLAGFGMKATQAGPIVGKALESTGHWNDTNCPAIASVDSITWPEDDGNNPAKPCFKLPDGTYIGKIIVLVNLSWYDPDVYLTDTGDLNITQNNNGDLILKNKDSLVDKIGAFTELVVAKVKAGLVETKELTAENKIISPLIETEEIVISDQELVISNQEGEDLIEIDSDGATTHFGDLIVEGDAGFSGNVGIGHLTAEEIDTNTLESKAISTDQMQINTDATVSGTLYADQIVTRKGTFGELMADKISAIRVELEELLANKIANYDSGVEKDDTGALDTVTGTSLASQAEEWETDPPSDSSTASTPGESAGLSSAGLSDEIIIASSLVIQGKMTVEEAFINKHLLVGNIAITKNSIATLADTLYIQPSGTGKVDILAGILVIEDNGSVTINGDLFVNGSVIAEEYQGKDGDFAINLAGESASGFGKLMVKGIDNEVVTSIDASGSAQFAGDLIASGSATFAKVNIATASAEPIIAGSQFGDLATDSAKLKTNATAGEGIIPTGKKEVIIYSDKLTSESLVYITPTTDTENQVLFVKQKASDHFTVAIKEELNKEIRFNYWIIN